MMPIIFTQRLMLIPPTDDFDHIRKLVGWLNDKDVTRYSEQRHVTHSLDTQWDYIASFHPPNLLSYIICDHKLIGTITAHIDTPNSVANMGIMIGDKTKWGQGYGAEAWSALMRQLFVSNVRKVEAGCVELNQGMIHVFQKTGMQFEGERANHFLVDGEPWAMEQWARYGND